MSKKTAFVFFVLCTWLLSLPLYAAENIKSTEHTTISLYSNGSNEVLAKFDLQPNWHIYWSNPGEVGQPTTVSARHSSVKIENQSVPSVRTVYDTMNEYLYEKTAFFQLYVDNPAQAKITFDFVECNDECKPETLTFDLASVPVATPDEWADIKQKADATFPIKLKLFSDGNSFILESVPHTQLKLIPTERDVIDENSVNINLVDKAVHVEWQAEENQKLSQALIMTPNKSYLAQIEYADGSYVYLLYILILAFLGGIILNAMPCVFPILSLKIFTLINHPKTSHSPWHNALYYTLGVLLSFLLLTTLLVALKNSGEAVGWGFQLQSPWFVGTMALIFFILFLFMAEWLHFPSFAGDFIHKTAAFNSFTTGFFAVLIASPCTGPFMGAAIGYAFMQNTAEVYAVFSALALGYALPYALIELYPTTISRIMPKPGRWMQRVKIILSVPILLTAVWLATVWVKQLDFSVENTTSFGEKWQPYDVRKIADLNEKGEKIFIDFTADWCLTCKFNEKFLIKTQRFKEFTARNNIHLFVADLTEYNDEYYKALHAYGRDGIPLYVYYNNGTYKILPLFFSLSDLTSED
ncbi:MAG: thioredoxin family protein [Alphaproteobacteria bacterium]|nr:thioredoxin family protein [Alphaproteobacteria bacterium]